MQFIAQEVREHLAALGFRLHRGGRSATSRCSTSGGRSTIGRQRGPRSLADPGRAGEQVRPDVSSARAGQDHGLERARSTTQLIADAPPNALEGGPAGEARVRHPQRQTARSARCSAPSSPGGWGRRGPARRHHPTSPSTARPARASARSSRTGSRCGLEGDAKRLLRQGVSRAARSCCARRARPSFVAERET